MSAERQTTRCVLKNPCPGGHGFFFVCTESLAYSPGAWWKVYHASGDHIELPASEVGSVRMW